MLQIRTHDFPELRVLPAPENGPANPLPEPPKAWFQVRFTSPPGLRIRRAVVVTAWNPAMQEADARANRRADRRLASALQGCGRAAVRVVCMAPDGSHAEPGWMWDAGVAEGRRWACRFQQAGFYTIERGLMRVVRTTDGRVWQLGPMQKFWLNHAGWRVIAKNLRKKH